MDRGAESGVTVILRTRDRPKFLARAVNSIASQGFPGVALCVVNDGGVSAHVEEIVRAGAPSGRLEFIHNEDCVGRPAARNLGFRRVRTQFFAVHDDDDSWSPDFLAKMAGFLGAPENARFIGAACHADAVFETVADGKIQAGAPRPHTRFKGALSLFDLLDLFAHPPPISTLFRAAALDLVPEGNVAMPVMYDCEWLARLLLHADVGVVPEVLAFYHQREEDGVALGAARNSIFEFGDDFHRMRTLIENELLRPELARGELGIGFALSLARRQSGGGATLSEDAVRYLERMAKRARKRRELIRSVRSVLARVAGLGKRG